MFITTWNSSMHDLLTIVLILVIGNDGDANAVNEITQVFAISAPLWLDNGPIVVSNQTGSVNR